MARKQKTSRPAHLRGIVPVVQHGDNTWHGYDISRRGWVYGRGETVLGIVASEAEASEADYSQPGPATLPAPKAVYAGLTCITEYQSEGLEVKFVARGASGEWVYGYADEVIGVAPTKLAAYEAINGWVYDHIERGLIGSATQPDTEATAVAGGVVLAPEIAAMIAAEYARATTDSPAMQAAAERDALAAMAEWERGPLLRELGVLVVSFPPSPPTACGCRSTGGVAMWAMLAKHPESEVKGRVLRCESAHCSGRSRTYIRYVADIGGAWICTVCGYTLWFCHDCEEFSSGPCCDCDKE